MYQQDPQGTGYHQTMAGRAERYQNMGQVQAGTPDRGSWMDYTQTPYQGQEAGVPMYRADLSTPSRAPQQYPPPVPPERQLSSSVSEYERSQMQVPRQAMYGMGQMQQQGQYPGRGPYMQQENLAAQEAYQYPTRGHPGPNQQYGNFPNMPSPYANPSTPNNPQGQTPQGTPGTYGNPYQYGRYEGQPPYR